jgi:argininosuccinate lyase
MKSQPLAYNKDNQEDKEPLFDAVDTLDHCLTALIGMVPNIEAKTEVMLQATLRGFATATDLADYLVRKNVPFRDAHDMVGQAVQLAIKQGKSLEELSLAELNGNATSVIEQDIYEVLTPQGSIASRDHIGGTAPQQVRAAIARARAQI